MSDKSPDNNAGTELVRKPLLIILSGPSGVGKDAVLHYLKKSSSSFTFVTTVTTRPRRRDEKDDIDYHFVSRTDFEKLLQDNELLESAEVYGNWYGVPKDPIRHALKLGHDVIVKVDVQGAATIKKLAPQAVFIFLMPPSIDELAVRLKQRYTETAESLAVRLQAYENELKQVPYFDYVVINHRNQVESAVNEVKAIIAAEKCRVTQRKINL